MPKRLVPNSDERTNLTPRRAAAGSETFVSSTARDFAPASAVPGDFGGGGDTWGDRIRRAALVDCARARYRD